MYGILPAILVAVAFSTVYADDISNLIGNTGFVGIGTTNPSAELEVVGDIKLSGSLISDGDICIGKCNVPSLIAHYTLDGNVADSFGNNDGTVTGIENYATGSIGQAFDFDGASYITLANESHFDFNVADSVSFSFWFKTDSTDTELHIIDKKNGGTGYSVWFVNGNLYFEFANAWADQIQKRTNAGDYRDGE